MGETTQIEWAESTINFYWGCTKVSEGCKFCYMYRNSPRYNRDATKVTKLNFVNIEKNLNKWSPRRIFVNSNSDTFHDSLSYENICEMCFCKENDVDPRTHIKADGAFQKFLDETNGGDPMVMLGQLMLEQKKMWDKWYSVKPSLTSVNHD